MLIKSVRNEEGTVFLTVDEADGWFCIHLTGEDMDKEYPFVSARLMVRKYSRLAEKHGLTVDSTPDPSRFEFLVKEADIYEVYEGFMEDLRKKVKAIQKKCAKYGCDFYYEEVGETFRDVPTGEKDPMTGKEIVVKCRFVRIKASGTARINDWEFVASVEHTDKGNIFSKAMTDLQVPVRYRTSPCICEHCRTNRARKDTFIIHNTKTGEFMQIGKSCLKDYTHGMSASGAAFTASLREIFEQDEIKPFPDIPGSMRYYDTSQVLDFCAEVIRKFGYTKGSESIPSTKQQVFEFWDFLHGNTRFWDAREKARVRELLEKTGFDPDSAEAAQMRKTALAWLDSQPADSDYMHNLKTVCSLERQNGQARFGLLLSLFPAWNRDLEKKEAAGKEKVSEYLGKAGTRITVGVDSIYCVTSWDTKYGTTYVYRITDTEGNVLTWKTSSFIDPDRLPKALTGTVKEHKTFRDVKQTEVTRCRLEYRAS